MSLNKVIDAWSSAMREPPAVEHGEIVDAVNQFYACVGKPAPAVVVCQSPWQMVMMKTVLQRQEDERLRACASKPSRDPFLPATARWMWRDLMEQYEEQTTAETRERFALNKKAGSKNFWFNAFNSLVADLPFVGPWAQLSPSISSEQHDLVKKINDFREQNPDVDRLRGHFDEHFPFASEDRVFVGAVSRELVEYAIGNQPGEIKIQVIANLMAPVVSSIYRGLFARLDLKLSSEEQVEHELKLLGMMTVNELVFTRSIVSRLPLLLYLAEVATSVRLSPRDLRLLNAILRLCKCTPVLLTFDGICLVCSHPEVQKFDMAQRLHSEDGPALSFSDGFEVYAWHGIRVSRTIIQTPDKIRAADILQEQNLELRRVMIERLGYQRFLKDCGAGKVQEDQYGQLYRKELPAPQEPLVIVKVKNSTAEPDGSFRDYYIRVPPHVKSAKEAVAWTFNVPEAKYNPDTET